MQNPDYIPKHSIIIIYLIYFIIFSEPTDLDSLQLVDLLISEQNFAKSYLLDCQNCYLAQT